MTFTSKLPTKPGAYWWKHDETYRPHPIEITEVGGTLYTLNQGYLMFVLKDTKGLWCGPLLSPDEVEAVVVEEIQEYIAGGER